MALVLCQQSPDNATKAKTYFEKGQQAERDMLPIFKPLEFRIKEFVEVLIQKGLSSTPNQTKASNPVNSSSSTSSSKKVQNLLGYH
jgi:hypothetical protein